MHSSDSYSSGFEALKATAPLSRDVRKHLSKVYSTLAGALMIAALGTVCDLSYNIGGTLTHIGSFVLVLVLCLTPATAATEIQRLALLLGAAFCQGASIGPLVESVLVIDPEIVITALVGTFCIFACFTAAALLAERRVSFFLSGILSSGLTLLFWVGLANVFFRSSMLLNVQLYFGLFVFIGFVVYDTQLIVEKAQRGNRDHIRHALELFLDFVGIFIRILVILARNSSGKKKSSSSSSSSSSKSSR